MTSFRSACWLAVLLLGTMTLWAEEPAKVEPLVDRHLLEPVWEGDVVQGESTVLLQDKDGGPLVGRLAFPVQEILSVRNSNREREYDVAKQVKLHANGTIELTVETQAPFVSMSELFKPTDSPISRTDGG